jgi:DNA-directed RNA polymerase subunit RPC12/RpoP
MPATNLSSGSEARKAPCPHCGKPYRTLVKRNYGIKIDGGIKQSVPLGSQWRCMACGKSYVTEDE